MSITLQLQDKNEIDKMTLTQDIDLPDAGLSPECRDLLEGLLKRDVPNRLGCRGRGFVFFNVFDVNHYKI